MMTRCIQAIAPCLLAIGLVVASPSAATGQTATGADVKAAFLYNFAKFVEWPAVAGTSQAPAFVIGVLADDAIADSLKELVRGKVLLGRPVVVKKLGAKDAPTAVHVLFIAATERAHLAALLQRLGSASVLTVSDADRFCASGGVIQFRMEADRVRFDVNLKAAAAAGLTVNSKLLTLAGVVYSSRQ